MQKSWFSRFFKTLKPAIQRSPQHLFYHLQLRRHTNVAPLPNVEWIPTDVVMQILYFRFFEYLFWAVFSRRRQKKSSTFQTFWLGKNAVPSRRRRRVRKVNSNDITSISLKSFWLRPGWRTDRFLLYSRRPWLKWRPIGWCHYATFHLCSCSLDNTFQ
jgi:hypothetical protein